MRLTLGRFALLTGAPVRDSFERAKVDRTPNVGREFLGVRLALDVPVELDVEAEPLWTIRELLAAFTAIESTA